MTFAEIVDAVILDTLRPDMGLVASGGDGRIPLSVQASLTYLHGLETWYKDIQQVELVFDAAGYIQVMDTSALPRFRNLNYLRKWDPSINTYQSGSPSILPPLYNSYGAVNPNQSLAFFKIIDPKNILDSYDSEKLDVAYQAGIGIYLKSSSSFQFVKCGYYQFPNLDYSDNERLFDSWIARDFPYAAIALAVSRVFQIVGQQDKHRAMNDRETGEVARQLAVLRQNSIVAEPMG